MQLRRLEVENIRSYETARVDFGPGTTLIVGDVGAGKTSLLYAVEMALFGAAEVDAAYLVRHGAARAEVTVRFEDGAHEYEISRRLRRVRRKGRELFEPERITFKEDGQPTSYSATEVRQRVIELLGFPDNANPQSHSDLWRWAIYVPQERMRDILSAKPQDRLETVRKALGVERYKIAAENAQLLAADLRAGARHSREEAQRLAHWDSEFADATQEADRMRGERAALDQAIVVRTKAVEQETAHLSRLRARAQDLEADRREAESLSREETADERGLADRHRVRTDRAAAVTGSRAEVEEASAASLELPAARTQWERAEKERVESRLALDRHAGELQSLATARADRVAADRRAAEAAGHVDRARSERNGTAAELAAALAEGPGHEPPAPTPYDLAEIERRLADARARDQASLEEVSRARGALEQVDELLRAGVCPTCHQAVHAVDFAPHQAEAASMFKGAEEKRRVSAETISVLEETRKARERFERAHERWASLETRRANARESLARREAALLVAEAARVDALAQASEARELTERLDPAEERGLRLRATLEQKEVSAANLRRAVEQGTIAEERARSAEAALRALVAEVERLDREIGIVEARRRERAHRITLLREKLGTSEALATELRGAEESARAAELRLREDQGALVRVDTRLDGEVRRAALAEKGRAERARLVVRADEYDRKAEWVSSPFRLHVLAMERDVLAHAQASFDRDFSRYFASLVDDPGLVARTNPDFTPEVAIEGDPTPAEALSGGERTSLALAFRLALASVVRSLGAVRLETLILDEPTDGFSSEQMIRMGELFDELHLPQVIVVSHETQLMSIADRSLRVRKEDGRSTVGGDAAGTKEPRGSEPAPAPATLAEADDAGEPAR